MPKVVVADPVEPAEPPRARGRPRKVKQRKPPTENQAASRAKFGEMSKRAKAYRVEHPELSYQECRKIVADLDK